MAGFIEVYYFGGGFGSDLAFCGIGFGFLDLLFGEREAQGLWCRPRDHGNGRRVQPFVKNEDVTFLG